MPVAGVTSTLTSLIGDHGVYAVFGLMIVAAVIPAASELVMLYAGAVASGAFSASHVVLFGSRIHGHAAAYVVMALAGLAGNLIGALVGWLAGTYAEKGLERHGKLVHVTPARLARTERWFERFGAIAVPVGFMTPGVRSFVAIPAGIGRVPLGRFLPYTLLGCAVFCFGFGAVGWAVGSSYGEVRRYVDYAVIAGVLLLIAYLVVRRRRAFRWPTRAERRLRP
jgi:membrane protein DedA with SNARE-associated domain